MREFPKKIAILLPSMKFGGGERVSLNLAREMKELGICVDIVVMRKEGELLLDAENHFRVIDLHCLKTYRLPDKLLKYIIVNRPCAVISSFWKLNLCACLSRLLLPLFKLILWEHSPPSKTPLSPTWLYAISATLFYPIALKIVAVSNGVNLDIKKHTIGLNRKLVTIYNPVAPPDRSLRRNYTSVNDVCPKIICVGRLDKEKNFALAIRAFAQFSKSNVAMLLIVGDGVLRESLEKLCKELKVDNLVKFNGFSSNPYQLIIDSDLLVMSSDFEGLPSVIIEALYCGLPVVSTDCTSGPRELLMDGEFGSL